MLGRHPLQLQPLQPGSLTASTVGALPRLLLPGAVALTSRGFGVFIRLPFLLVNISVY